MLQHSCEESVWFQQPPAVCASDVLSLPGADRPAVQCQTLLSPWTLSVWLFIAPVCPLAAWGRGVNQSRIDSDRPNTPYNLVTLKVQILSELWVLQVQVNLIFSIINIIFCPPFSMLIKWQNPKNNVTTVENVLFRFLFCNSNQYR